MRVWAGDDGNTATNKRERERENMKTKHLPTGAATYRVSMEGCSRYFRASDTLIVSYEHAFMGDDDQRQWNYKKTYAQIADVEWISFDAGSGQWEASAAYHYWTPRTVHVRSIDSVVDEQERIDSHAAFQAQRAEDNRQSQIRHEAFIKALLPRREWYSSVLRSLPQALLNSLGEDAFGSSLESSRQHPHVVRWQEPTGSLNDPDLVNPEDDTTWDARAMVNMNIRSLALISYAWDQTFGTTALAALPNAKDITTTDREQVWIEVTPSEGKTPDDIRHDVARCLPDNYEVASLEGNSLNVVTVVGYDEAGYTADEYVVPRLRSAMLAAKVLCRTRGMALAEFSE